MHLRAETPLLQNVRREQHGQPVHRGGRISNDRVEHLERAVLIVRPAARQRERHGKTHTRGVAPRLIEELPRGLLLATDIGRWEPSQTLEFGD